MNLGDSREIAADFNSGLRYIAYEIVGGAVQVTGVDSVFVFWVGVFI
jgi:hypothetical protein